MDRDEMTGNGGGGSAATAIETQVATLTAQVKALAAQREADAQPDALTAEELASKYHLNPEHFEGGASSINAAAHVATQKAREAIRSEVQGIRQEFEQKTDAALEAVFLRDMDMLAPGWEAINATREFNAWLKDTGKFTELSRARDASSAAGCAQVFRDFVTAKAAAQAAQTPQAPNGQQPAAWDVPGGAQNSMLPRSVPTQQPVDSQGPVFESGQVLTFLDEYAKGLRPTMEDAKMFRELNKAVQEGRVR
jgi:hypothetical protein